MLKKTFAILLVLALYSNALLGAVSMGTMGGADTAVPIIDFTTMGQINPVVEIAGNKVSFGSAFLGQVLGTMPNEVIDSTPSSPLQLDPNAPDVMTIFETTSMGIVLGGSDNGKYLTTPIAILFENPVTNVFFDLGHLDHSGTTRIEAFDVDGNSLGSFDNPQEGWQTIVLADSSGDNIAGISIYIPEGGMDWEGFAIDKIGFSFSDDGGGTGGDPDPPGMVPEPGTLVVWAGLGVFGLVGALVREHRQGRKRSRQYC